MKTRFLLMLLMGLSLIQAVHAQCAGNDFACIQRMNTIGALHNDPALCAYGYNPNCYNNSSYSAPPQIIHVYDYLNLLWTKDSQPFFFKTLYKSPALDFDYAQADQDALNACNAHEDQRPCQHSTAVVGDACIAYLDTPDIAYGQAGDTCQEAAQIVIERCMAKYQDLSICQRVQTKQPADLY